jgi:hypothetical protein
LALGTETPVNDLGFVNSEAMGFRGLKTGGMADGTIDVECGGAATAYEVVVVVPHSGFVK